MTSLLGLSGSLRAGSFNTALLKAAQSMAGAGIGLDVAAVHGVPLFDGDEEQQHGTPRACSVFGADGTVQDEAIRRQLSEFVQAFAAFAAATAQARQENG